MPTASVSEMYVKQDSHDFKLRGITVTQEVDHFGNHRLRVGKLEGKWAKYTEVSTVTLDNVVYVGFTGFYKRCETVEEYVALNAIQAISIAQLLGLVS